MSNTPQGRGPADDPTDGPAVGAAVRQADTTWSVSQLAAAVGRTIQQAFSHQVWVRGEIIGYSVASSGHIYFKLIEPGAGGDRRGARMQVALFKGHQRYVNRGLAAAGGLTLSDGIEVRIRAEVEYYADKGQIQLIMSGIDSHFTLGALALERQRTLAELAASGLLRRNAAIPLPLVPLRVGLVTAANSAAHADFIHELKASGYAFRVQLCDTRVQGITAETDLIAALQTLSSAEVDVIALVRGGGDRTDLLAFDLASVASAIATCPVPVFSGIGHEIDTSVADHAAHTTAKTPTACAALLVNRVRNFDERLDRARRDLSRAALAHTVTANSRLRAARSTVGLLTQRRLSDARVQLSQSRTRLSHNATHHCRTTSNNLSEMRRLLQRSHVHTARANESLRSARARLDRAAARHLAAAHQRLSSAAALVSAVAPMRTLARGFSITRDADGAIVRAPPAIGETIYTQTQHAQFASTIRSADTTASERTTDG